MDRNYDFITYISIFFFLLRRSGVANFQVIIKIAIILIKAIIKDSVKLKIIRNYVLNAIFI